MAAEDAKRIVSQFWREVYNRGDFELLEAIVAPGHKLHDPVNDADVYGSDGLKDLLQEIRDFAPEARVNIEDQMDAEAERVITRFTVLVPRHGALATESGVAEEPLELSGISISRVSSGMIEESWVNWDDHSLWEALNPPVEDWRWPPWR